ncbi:hypothetical protein P9139_11340 [Curtobacterium flaccumfaciens]|nr:hypothetical protein P9139_11340 [Curtobacterium flaccumfaciens]
MSVLVSDLDAGATGDGGAQPLVIRNRGGAEALAEALVEQGHGSFAVLAGDPDLVTARARVDGFLAGLAGRDIRVPEERVVESEFSRDGGYRAMSALLDTAGWRPERPAERPPPCRGACSR